MKLVHCQLEEARSQVLLQQGHVIAQVSQLADSFDAEGISESYSLPDLKGQIEVS
jgi:hypothetical protein